MRRFFRVLIRLGLVVVGSTLVEGCLNRDPGVLLGRGYEISATSPGSPDLLNYNSLHDEQRKDSEWLAYKRDDSYTLSNERTHESLSFDSREKWRAAIREKKAQPVPIDLMLSLGNVSRFSCDNAFIIGLSDRGYFILDMESAEVETYSSKRAWAQAVAAQTHLDPDKLLYPRSWWLVERDWPVWAAHIVFLMLTLPWAIWPAFARQRTVAEVEQSPRGETA